MKEILLLVFKQKLVEFKDSKPTVIEIYTDD